MSHPQSKSANLIFWREGLLQWIYYRHHCIVMNKSVTSSQLLTRMCEKNVWKTNTVDYRPTVDYRLPPELVFMHLKHGCIFPQTEQQASSASSLHLSHRRVLQCCEEWHGQHCMPGTQDPSRLSAQVRRETTSQGMDGRKCTKINDFRMEWTRIRQDRWYF